MAKVRMRAEVRTLTEVYPGLSDGPRCHPYLKVRYTWGDVVKDSQDIHPLLWGLDCPHQLARAVDATMPLNTPANIRRTWARLAFEALSAHLAK